MVRIDGLLAQETVEVLSLQPAYRVRAAIDTATPAAGGRHYVLFENRRATMLAAYLAAVQMAGVPLPLSVSGSLWHEQGQSLVTDLAEASYGTFQSVRGQAEALLQSGRPPQAARGPRYPLGKGYHTCVYLGGLLDLLSLGAREDGAKTILVATLDTAELGGVGRHEIVFDARPLQALVLALRDEFAGTPIREVEANVWGKLHSMQGYTMVRVTGIDFPQACMDAVRTKIEIQGQSRAPVGA